MGCCTGLHTDKAWLEPSKELENLSAPQLLSDTDRASTVDALNLKRVLRQIETDRRDDLHSDPTSGRMSDACPLV